MTASGQGHLDVVTVLLQSIATEDVCVNIQHKDTRYREKNTTLDYARSNGHAQIVKILQKLFEIRMSKNVCTHGWCSCNLVMVKIKIYINKYVT